MRSLKSLNEWDKISKQVLFGLLPEEPEMQLEILLNVGNYAESEHKG